MSLRDDVFFDVNEGRGIRENLSDGTIGDDDYRTHNAAMTYVTPDEKIELTGWVKNFTDEERRIQAFDLTQDSF